MDTVRAHIVWTYHLTNDARNIRATFMSFPSKFPLRFTRFPQEANRNIFSIWEYLPTHFRNIVAQCSSAPLIPTITSISRFGCMYNSISSKQGVFGEGCIYMNIVYIHIGIYTTILGTLLHIQIHTYIL